jgi:hypothetical protein
VSNKSTQRLHYVSSVQKLGEFKTWMHPQEILIPFLLLDLV